jgi:hypothetical protein
MSSRPMSLNSEARPLRPRQRYIKWADTIRLLAGVGVIGSSAVGLLAYGGLQLPAGSDAVGAVVLMLLALVFVVRR